MLFKSSYLCVLELGGKAGNIFAQFDVLALYFIQKVCHTLQFNLYEDKHEVSGTLIFGISVC